MNVAFFDVDETLIREKSMLAFQAFYFERCRRLELPMNEPFEGIDAFRWFFSSVSRSAARETANRAYYQSFAGRSVHRVRTFCELWLASRLAASGNAFWRPEGIAELRRCRAYGKRIVLVSGAFPDLLRPLARRLCVDAVLATEPLSEGGIYTGEIRGDPCIGDGKAARVRAFALREGVELRDCLAVGDHRSDMPMLDAVGRAKVVRGDALLEREALARGWQILAPGDGLAAGAPPHEHRLR